MGDDSKEDEQEDNLVMNTSIVSDGTGGGDAGGGDPGRPSALDQMKAELRAELRAESKASNDQLNAKVDQLNAKVDQLNKQVQKLDLEVKGIRNAFTPATVYALLETSISVVFAIRNTEYTKGQENERYNPDQRGPRTQAVSLANHVLRKLLGNETRQRGTGSNPNEDKTFYEEALSGLALFLKTIDKKYILGNAWPPSRNTVCHNGMLLKALYPKLSSKLPESDHGNNIPPLSDRAVQKHVADIMRHKQIYAGEESINRCKNLLVSKLRCSVKKEVVTEFQGLINAGKEAPQSQEE